MTDKKKTNVIGTFTDADGNEMPIGTFLDKQDRVEKRTEFHTSVGTKSHLAKRGKSVKPRQSKAVKRESGPVRYRPDLLPQYQSRLDKENKMKEIANIKGQFNRILGYVLNWNAVCEEVFKKTKGVPITTANVCSAYKHFNKKEINSGSAATYLGTIWKGLGPAGHMTRTRLGAKGYGYYTLQTMDGMTLKEAQLIVTGKQLEAAQSQVQEKEEQKQSFTVDTAGVDRITFAFAVSTDGKIDFSFSIINK